MPKKIGIVGGIGWRSTVDYYSAFHEFTELSGCSGSWSADGPSLELAIESLDLEVARALLGDGLREGLWDGFDNYHRAALTRLERSEADVALIACNTPHERLREISRGTKVSIVDLFGAVSTEVSRLGGRRLLVLGTPTTMRSTRYRALLAANGIQMVAPAEEVARKLQSLIHDLQQGRDEGAFERLLGIIRHSLSWPTSQDFVGLHCTELALALADRRSAVWRSAGYNLLNASIVHVKAGLEAAGFSTDPEGPKPARPSQSS